jgi:hypothetical protein
MASKPVARKTEAGKHSGPPIPWPMGAWGVAAVLALVAVAFASQAGSGGRHPAPPPSSKLPARPVTTVRMPPPDPAIERLTAQIRQLVADGDRLNARLTGLEHHLDDITGSIKRLAETAPAREAKIVAAQRSDRLAPIVAAPATTAVATIAQPALPAQSNTPQSAAVAPNRDAPPAPQNVPMPPTRVAAAVPIKPEYGVALAGASSLTLTHMQWAAVKANFGPMLSGLQPRVLTEHRGKAAHYRLLAGPLPSHAAATKLCARILAGHGNCQPIKFGGEPL